MRSRLLVLSSVLLIPSLLGLAVWSWMDAEAESKRKERKTVDDILDERQCVISALQRSRSSGDATKSMLEIQSCMPPMIDTTLPKSGTTVDGVGMLQGSLSVADVCWGPF